MYENYVRLRDAKGVTDYEVARATGIAPSVISEWKRGKYNLKVDKLMKIASYFGVTLDDLVKEPETVE